jgi:hypothetical protein
MPPLYSFAKVESRNFTINSGDAGSSVLTLYHKENQANKAHFPPMANFDSHCQILEGHLLV